MDEIQRVEIEVLVEQIRHLNASVAKLEKTIREQGPKLPGWKNLRSIKGIGDIGGAIMLATIGNVHDFADEGKLAAYFGIVPRRGHPDEHDMISGSLGACADDADTEVRVPFNWPFLLARPTPKRDPGKSDRMNIHSVAYGRGRRIRSHRLDRTVRA